MRLKQEVPAAAGGSRETPAQMCGSQQVAAARGVGRKYQVRVEDEQLTIRLEESRRSR